MGVVYLLVERGEEARYKIGITKYNAKKRIKSLQTGNANTIEVVHEFESKYNRKIENVLHRKYNLSRLEGEWFHLEKKDIQNFISECQYLHDSFNFLEDSGNPFI